MAVADLLCWVVKMTEEERQKAADEEHRKLAEANKNAEYIDLNETNKKLKAQKEAAMLGKNKLGGQ